MSPCDQGSKVPANASQFIPHSTAKPIPTPADSILSSILYVSAHFQKQVQLCFQRAMKQGHYFKVLIPTHFVV